MEKMIGVINNNLRSVITGIKEHREETEKESCCNQCRNG